MDQGLDYQEIKSQKNFWKNELLDIIKTLVLLVIIYFVIKIYIAQPFLVKGRSMETSFSDGDYLIVDQLTYKFNDPKRFEVVVFHTEFIPNGKESEYYIKRVIGIPGDRVVIKDGKVILYENNSEIPTKLEEDYIIKGLKTIYKEPIDILLKENQYYVLGDNRGNSSDSRYFGTVDKSYIIGKPFIRLFPFNSVKMF